MKIAIQGQEGSYHSTAARALAGDEVNLIYCESFYEVFDLLSSGGAQRAVVAVENSLFGSINQVYQLFDKHDCRVLAEHYLRIQHCLIGSQQIPLEEIKEVHSQSMALAQCDEFLNSSLSHAVRIEQGDTAGSVRSVIEAQDSSVVAIAGREAAVEYGGVVLKEGVETNKHNYTRFFLIALSLAEVEGRSEPNKATVVLTTDHSQGALARALLIISGHEINMTRIESRPIVGSPSRYRFYIDLLAGRRQTEAVTEDLILSGCKVDIMGGYQEGDIA